MMRIKKVKEMMLMMMLGHVDLAKVRVRARGSEALPSAWSGQQQREISFWRQEPNTLLFHHHLSFFSFSF